MFDELYLLLEAEAGYDIINCGRNDKMAGQRSQLGAQAGYKMAGQRSWLGTQSGYDTMAGQRSELGAQAGYDIIHCCRDGKRASQQTLFRAKACEPPGQ